MRLWHKDLIPVLPNKQLLAQWRECVGIARNIAVKGTPNHLLVNKVMEYSIWHFMEYTQLVCCELEERGYMIKRERFICWLKDWDYGTYIKELHYPSYDELFAGWHTDRYLTQCFYNLQEKYDCGGMTYEEYKALLRFDIERRVYR